MKLSISLTALLGLLPAAHASEGGHSSSKKIPAPKAESTEVAEGFRTEVFFQDLTFPTSLEFGDDGTIFIAESGYSYGSEKPEPRILLVNPSGERQGEITDGLEGPVNDLLWHDGRLYISHRGKISVVKNGKVIDVVTGLPSEGDHHNNQISAGPDGKLYFGQGTATNSGVVGLDNFKMGWLKEYPEFHDIAPREYDTTGQSFETGNPLTTDESDQAVTGAFQPFDVVRENGIVGTGIKASGTILGMNPDGSDLEVYASGLRNPYGVAWSPDGSLFATENGADIRGSRPIANDKEDLYEIVEDAWYGWPDYGSGIPFTDSRFKPKDGPQPEFLLSEHPPVEEPVATFPKHSSIAKVAFAPAGAFGFEGQMFIAFFGHMAPVTGNVETHGGHRVVRVDPATMESETFFAMKSHGHGESSHGGAETHDSHASDSGNASSDHEHRKKESGHGDDSATSGHGGAASAGPRRLLDVCFSPEGDELYIVDFGAMLVDEKGIHPKPRTGLIWRVSPNSADSTR